MAPGNDREPKRKPVIFIAAANAPVNSEDFLRKLGIELNGIREKLSEIGKVDSGSYEVIERSSVTLEIIFKTFRDYRNRITVFHFAGHTYNDLLLLETGTGGNLPAYDKGLVPFLQKQNGLKLVFFNGCSNKDFVGKLKEAGIPAAIGTHEEIPDKVASTISPHFYECMANKKSLDEAWTETVDYIKSLPEYSAFLRENPDAGENGDFPWEIQYNGDGEENIREWKLEDAVTDPLFGLPPIPSAYGFPPNPYLFLKQYEREHARVFFGRSDYIRELYDGITLPENPPIILLYGQSGVGKTSLLEAGLLPRLEISHLVRYARRDKRIGLADTLKETVDVCLREAGESDEKNTIAKKWKWIESKTGKPLVIILDQLEEVFTDPNSNYPDEFEDFAVWLKTIFENPGDYPGGKLILGYRKEYHAEIEDSLMKKRLDYNPLLLKPLKRSDILEVVEGLIRTPALKTRYKVELDNEDLPETIAAHILIDKKTPVAPVLQIILTKMWEMAKVEGTSGRTFKEEHFQEIRDKGIDMKYFFEEQMEKLQSRDKKAVKSGLALDILKFHTTELSTSCSRNIKELHHTYRHIKKKVLNKLLDNLKQLYLLTDTRESKKETSLAHDTLAPIVIKEYNYSEKVGQRASRILVEKMKDFNKSKSVVWLNESGLKIVEKGKKGMRALGNEEKDLLRTIKKRIIQEMKWKRMMNIGGIFLACLILIAAFIAIKEGKRAAKEKEIAEKNYIQSEAHRLAVQAQLTVKENPLIALRIAEAACTLDENKTTIKTIHKIYWENSFYKTLAKQDNPMNSAAFSPDGRYIFTGSRDGTARLYDSQGNVLQDFTGTGYPAHFAVFSPDGKYILTVSDDNAVRLWDHNGNMERFYMGHRDSVNAAAFSPDSKYILTVSNDYTGRIWDRGGNKTIRHLNEHESAVVSTTFSHDGKYILTGSYDGIVRLWDSRGNKIRDFKYHEKPVNAIAFSPDGRYILTGSDEHIARMWNREGRELRTFEGHEDSVTFAAFSPGGKYVLTGSADKTTRLWDLEGKELHVLKGHENAVIAACFSPGDNRILTVSFDSTLRLWDVKGEEHHILEGHKNWVKSAAFSPDSNHIVTGSFDRTACLWNLEGKKIRCIGGHNGPVTSVTFSPDGKYILTGSGDGEARLWDLQGELSQTFGGHGAPVTSVDISPDGQYILTGSADNTARVWNRTGNPRLVFKGHEGSVNSAAFSPDGRFILTGSDDNTACLWDLNGNRLQAFDGHEGSIFSAAFSPDGNHVLTGSDDKTARLWDLKGNVLQVFKSHENSVTSVGFSPDGKYVLTGSNDYTARIWDVNGNELKSFKRHKSWINSAVFSPNGKYILTGSSDNTARLWEVGVPLEDFLRDKDLKTLTEKQKHEYGITGPRPEQRIDR